MNSHNISLQNHSKGIDRRFPNRKTIIYSRIVDQNVHFPRFLGYYRRRSFHRLTGSNVALHNMEIIRPRRGEMFFQGRWISYSSVDDRFLPLHKLIYELETDST